MDDQPECRRCPRCGDDLVIRIYETEPTARYLCLSCNWEAPVDEAKPRKRKK